MIVSTRTAPDLALINADIHGSTAQTLRISRGRIAAIGTAPQAGDRVLDLHGDRVLPGLINAHEHLQLNGFSRLIYRPRYQNASQWIGDVEGRLHSDPQVRAHRAIAREDRLLLGGLKNLLSGVTTVAHHDPLYDSLTDARFPVRVLSRYGWSHSLFLDGAAQVQSSHHATPAQWPWMIHAAEGTDAAAAAEFECLASLGCVTANTVLIHGVGLSAVQHMQLAQMGGGLIWCPYSNLQLFGTTVAVRALVSQGRVALGSDSRISGSRDLLEELQAAAAASGLGSAELAWLVTGGAAQLLRLTDRGVLERGALADILVLPAGMALERTTRADVRLVLIGGTARYGDPTYRPAHAAGPEPGRVRVDGHDKFLERALLSRLMRSRVRERGLEWEQGGSDATINRRREHIA
jgi:cytosine/adenosine deaminase-related metal-dependent hydrolase